MLDTKFDRNVKENLNMNGFAITMLKSPVSSHDAVSKLYLQIYNQEDDVNLEALVKLGDLILDLFNKYRNNLTLYEYREELSTCFFHLSTMISKCSNVTELLAPTSLIVDLKVVIIKIIEILPKEKFKDIKVEMITVEVNSHTERWYSSKEI